MAKPIKFAHVLFSTRRFEEMVEWYENLFEATTVHRDPAIAFLTYDDENHRFGFANLDILRPEPIKGAGIAETGVNHLSYTYASVGDLFGVYERLRDQGITPYWPIHHGMTLSLYYLDPDGNRIELQVDCYDSEDSIAYMKGEEFAANPIGVTYDPDALLERHRAGAPDEELLRRPDGPVAVVPAEHGVS